MMVLIGGGMFAVRCIFEQAMSSLLEQDYGHIIEVGPHPVLAGYIKEMMATKNSNASLYQSMHRHKTEHVTFHEVIAGLFVNGCDIDFQLWPTASQEGEVTPTTGLSLAA